MNKPFNEKQNHLRRKAVVGDKEINRLVNDILRDTKSLSYKSQKSQLDILDEVFAEIVSRISDDSADNAKQSGEE